MDSIIVGLTGGIIYALTGFIKSYKKEKFDAKKFLRTMVIAVIAGITLALSGQEVNFDAINVMIAAGEVAVIEQLIIAIFRAIKG